MSSVREVKLHIERLVLRGLPGVQGEVLAESLRTEIQRQLSLPGVAQRLAAAPPRALLRPAAPLPAAGSRALGSAAAQRIVEGL